MKYGKLRILFANFDSCNVDHPQSFYQFFKTLKVFARFKGLRRFHFDVHVFLLEIVLVKFDWVLARAREIFETLKLELTIHYVT